MTTKPDMTRIWASGAAPTNIEDPEVTTVGKFAAGWVDEIPPFEQFNFLQQLFTTSAAYINEQGIGEYDTVTDYPVNALVKGSNGAIYRAASANGPASTAKNPVGDTTEVWVYALRAGTLKGTQASANTYTAKLPSSLAAGMLFDIDFAANNTSSCTLNTVPIKLNGGAINPVSGDIIANVRATVVYRASPTAHFALLNPGITGRFPEAPEDGLQYVRQDAAWTIVQGVPTGAVFYVPASAAPFGSIKANGASLSRTTYADLWAYAQASGNLVTQASKQTGQFGTGDESTTFTIPDLRGVFARGWDDGRSLDPGRVIGSYQADEFEAHGKHGNVQTTIGNAEYAAGRVPAIYQTSGSSDRGGDETRPKNAALLACIQY